MFFICTSGKWILIHLIYKVALTSNSWLHCYRLVINVGNTLKLKFNFQTCYLLLNNAFTILLVMAMIISQQLSLKILSAILLQTIYWKLTSKNFTNVPSKFNKLAQIANILILNSMILIRWSYFDWYNVKC